MDFQAIFIAGPQGSGKGTQGKKLADKLGFLFFGMGGILREIQADPQFGDRLRLLDKGMLLPDDFIIEILKERLAGVPADRGIVFDGVPRRIGQAEFLVSFLRGRGVENMVTVFIDLPRPESIKRLLKRANEEARADDTVDAIERRFADYDDTMPAVIDYLKSETSFFEIDGRPTADEVEQNIDMALRLP